jgi:hypothetical protein
MIKHVLIVAPEGVCLSAMRFVYVVCDDCGAEAKISYSWFKDDLYSYGPAPDGWTTRMRGQLQQAVCPQCSMKLVMGAAV